MVIRNNRRSLITLEYKKGGKRTLVPIAAGKEVDITELLHISQIISMDFFDNGKLSIVEEVAESVEETVEIERIETAVEQYSNVEESEEIEEDVVVESENDKNKKKSKKNNKEQN